MSITSLRIAAGCLICFLVMYFVLQPLDLWANYVVLGWGTRYWGAIAYYSGLALALFIILGIALGFMAGTRAKLVPLALAFGVGCTMVLMYRQPFLSLAPNPPTWGELALAYAHTLMAPIGTLLGILLVSRFFSWRRTKGQTT